MIKTLFLSIIVTLIFSNQVMAWTLIEANQCFMNKKALKKGMQFSKGQIELMPSKECGINARKPCLQLIGKNSALSLIESSTSKMFSIKLNNEIKNKIAFELPRRSMGQITSKNQTIQIGTFFVHFSNVQSTVFFDGKELYLIVGEIKLVDSRDRKDYLLKSGSAITFDDLDIKNKAPLQNILTIANTIAPPALYLGDFSHEFKHQLKEVLRWTAAKQAQAKEMASCGCTEGASNGSNSGQIQNGQGLALEGRSGKLVITVKGLPKRSGAK